MADSSSAAPASNQSSLFFSLLPKVLRAVWTRVFRMWFHRVEALSGGQFSRASSMALVKRSRSSGLAVLAVLMRGQGFGLERWTRLGRRRTLQSTREWSVSQSAKLRVTSTWFSNDLLVMKKSSWCQ